MNGGSGGKGVDLQLTKSIQAMGEREIWIDWLRVVACFLVMMTHASEPFYLGGEGTLVLTRSDALWVSVLNVLPRACVALFVVASSYLLLPMRYSSGEFVRRRLSRILVPFLVWTLVYALALGDPEENLRSLALNFNYAAGHLWFVYMLIGLYLLVPMLSPWAERVTRRELSVYIGIWLFTTIIPFIRTWAGGQMPIAFGPTGIPAFAKYPLWGEASWNAYGTFYYLSGFIGYMLVGLYFRRFVGKLSWRRTLAIALPAFILGFVICSTGFYHSVMTTSGGTFPVSADVSTGAMWEQPWMNDTLGVALMTVAWLLLLRKIKTGGSFYHHIVLPVSRASYGMYLCHMFVLGIVSVWLCEALGVGTEGVIGVWTTPIQMIGTACISFVVVSVVCVVVRKIPRVGKWIMG